MSFSAELIDSETCTVAIRLRLTSVFFSRVHPYAAMIHPASFHHRLFLGASSPILLDAMYALAAHLSAHPAMVEAFPPNTPQWARGEAFAERAHQMASRVIDLRLAWSDDEIARDKGTWEETEFVQALVLLGVYYSSTRQVQLSQKLLDIALDILHPTPDGTMAPPSSLLGPGPDFATVAECRVRAFWMIALHDFQDSVNSRSRRVHSQVLYSLPLPGDELQWERFGGNQRSTREPGHRQGLTISGAWPQGPEAVGELGHLLRILAVFSDVMSVANNASKEESRGSPAQHEQALRVSIRHSMNMTDRSLGHTHSLVTCNSMRTLSQRQLIDSIRHCTQCRARHGASFSCTPLLSALLSFCRLPCRRIRGQHRGKLKRSRILASCLRL